MGKSGDAADQNVLGTTGNSIRGTVVSVPEPAEQLTSGLAENGNGNFHPDGSRIIFQSNRDGKWQIYELNLTDMSELRLHESDFIEENPYKIPPKYEKLVGDLTGAYSRRINIQHRLVYQVYKELKVVKIIRMWSHYGE